MDRREIVCGDIRVQNTITTSSRKKHTTYQWKTYYI